MMSHWERASDISKQLLESTKGIGKNKVDEFLGVLCSEISHVIAEPYPTRQILEEKVIDAFASARKFADNGK